MATVSRSVPDLGEITPTGHTQVKADSKGRRSYYAYWTDADGKHGKRLGPAHVKDSGRRTPRGAVIWRAGDGPKPTAEHLTPKEAAARLQAILATALRIVDLRPECTLQQAVDGWIAARSTQRGLKRSTTMDYEDLFERLYRDLGADTPVDEFAQEQLEDYFATFEAQRVLGSARAERAKAAGDVVREVTIERWIARPPGAEPVEVATKQEAVRLAAQLGGTWKHRRRGAYRVVPTGHQRARRVTRAQAETLRDQGWHVERRSHTRMLLCAPAAPQTRNKYRDLLAAVLDYARRQGWLDANPLADVPRMNRRADRERILRRGDFYDRDEMVRLLAHAPTHFEEAFWLCGFHAGMRLPGEALGLRWGAVDFEAGVLRIYDNWVRNAVDDTKTSDSAPVPMTPRLTKALRMLKRRPYRTADDDHVFTRDALGRPASERELRAAFKVAQTAAALKPIPMYNTRHSFGTGLAREGVDVRTIQALMRHNRLTTTEQYMAYAPQPDLARRVTAALEPSRAAGAVGPTSADRFDPKQLLSRLEEEVPAKWTREIERILAEMT
jgi:integrase